MQHMARLNEPPQPATESIEALKRRFVRQNREIARANSTQSVRIRDLECEVSRLLGENVSLREEVIKLNSEISVRADKNVLGIVNNVKGKLEAKLSELGALVQNLGNAQKATSRERIQKRRSIDRGSPKRSPAQRIWKNTLTLSEAVEGAEGRLPPIVEDKYYPRRTLDAEELLGVIGEPTNLTDSPDLGPPPIAHFERGDPIKFDPSEDGPSRTQYFADSEEQDPQLSVNLETRRKRRESSHRKDTDERKARPDPPKAPVSREGMSDSQPLRAGAKRKLNVREETEASTSLDDRTDHVPLLGDQPRGDSRKGERSDIKISNNKPPLALSSRTQNGKERPNDIRGPGAKSNRKALEPKSVNSDPMNSPLKRKGIEGKDRIADAKDDLVKIAHERDRKKEKSHGHTAQRPDRKQGNGTSTIPTSVPNEVELAPETPALPTNELFSPDPSEVSASRAESRDTPPPPDLGPDTETGSFGRASRRPKGTVNYAQPNLRDKMRRPTAELVDAVAAEERARRANIARAAKETSKAASIKQEDVSNGLPVWKTNEPKEGHRTLEEPASPLGNKTGESTTELPPSIVTERRRRTIAPVRNDVENRLAKGPSGAASAIAALAPSTLRAKENDEAISVSGMEKPNETQEPTERPSIYDFTGSSPNLGISGEDIQVSNSVAKSSRSSLRRHSTVSATSDQGKGTLSISRRGERRRESTLGTRKEEIEGTGTVPHVARTKSVLDLRNGGEESTLSRGERAASRRRSMML